MDGAHVMCVTPEPFREGVHLSLAEARPLLLPPMFASPFPPLSAPRLVPCLPHKYNQNDSSSTSTHCQAYEQILSVPTETNLRCDLFAHEKKRDLGSGEDLI